jgi:hypothetical protein
MTSYQEQSPEQFGDRFDVLAQMAQALDRRQKVIGAGERLRKSA